MAECSASVRIATEPVSTPATILSAISARVRGDRDRRRAAARPGVLRRWPAGAAPRAQPFEEPSSGVAAVGDRVLLLVGELGHRAPRRLVGDEDRVVAEAAGAAAAPRRACPRSALRTRAPRPPASRTRSRTRSARGRPRAPRGAASGGSRRRSRPRPRSARCGRRDATPAPRPRSRSRRRRPAVRSRRAAARALISALSAYVSPVSSGLSRPSGNGSNARPGSSRSNSRTLCALRVARITPARLPAPPAALRSRSGRARAARRGGCARAASAPPWPAPRPARPRRS